MVTQNSANTYIGATANQEVTMPSQPGFCATTANKLNVTGDGTTYSIIFDSEYFDQGGDFVPGTGTFAAPITGRYEFSTDITWDAENGSGVNQERSFINASNYNALFSNLPTREQVTNFFGINAWIRVAGTIIVDMDASDTCTIDILMENGTKTADLEKAKFSGYLIS